MNEKRPSNRGDGVNRELPHRANSMTGEAVSELKCHRITTIIIIIIIAVITVCVIIIVIIFIIVISIITVVTNGLHKI